ncbi:FtsK/SpoIIIE domain-containing protein [Niameybacter massiliensis]|uniref:FtsK/SpoIIIE domain-containing protein n=1 Tax=Holtiella tumoricola TaxID=3018743 RepID=A0AA42J131_9FIRM|nr:FtsK/SpoIIIE domain-containing protein [Holtiella tumoricola]MDA3732094.1 FtsK/SpoIIIE domain-containing protein [Holtiella tumoricola]
MILGTMMMLTGATGLFGMSIAPEVFKYIKNRKRSKKDVELTLDEQYTQFFSNLGIIDPKTDWIKAVGEVEKHEFYSKVSFYLSDTLSVADFKKHEETIRQKLRVDNLEIYYENGRMIFRSRVSELPIIPYEFEKTPKNLIPLGINLDGDVTSWDVKKDPHAMIIAGTGGGKSNLLNCIIDHIINNSPKSKLFLIDMKNGIELGIYQNVRNVVAYAEDLQGAKLVIAKIEEEFKARVQVMKEAGYRDFSKYVNDKPNTTMKRAYIIIDEFPDLNDDEDAMDSLIELIRKVRAVGMHILLASQRATVDSIPSSLKNNVYCKIGMKMSDAHNSNLLIGRDGLEKLNAGESISIIDTKEVFFKAYLIEDSVIEETVKKFAKLDSEVNSNEPISSKVTKLF